MATSIDQLSQPTQALLQAIGSVQPATYWKLDNGENTVVFTPTEINYNPLCQQAQQYALILQDPRSIKNVIKFSIKPPRIRSHLREDGVWSSWWITALLV